MKKLLLNAAVLLLLGTGANAQNNWIWQNPIPQGKTLKSVHALNQNEVFATGIRGAFISSSDGGDNWSVIGDGTDLEYNAVFFVNSSTGWIAGQHGEILKTTNGGLSFSPQFSDTTVTIYSLDFADASNGLACGTNGLFLKTSDGGASWIRSLPDTLSFSSVIRTGSTIYLAGENSVLLKSTDNGSSWNRSFIAPSFIINSLSFTDASTGYACGDKGRIYKTTNAGASWQIVYSDSAKWLKSVKFFDANTGIAAGWPGVILRTTDAGANWELFSQGSRFDISSVSVTQSGYAWLVGDNGLTMRSTDFGSSWEFQSGGVAGNINSIRFLNSFTGFVVGDNGLVLRTDDTGETWSQQNSGTSENLYDVFFKDSTTGWIVGNKGTMLKTLDGGLNWAKVNIADLTTDALYSIEGSKFNTKVVGRGGVLLETSSFAGDFWYKISVTPRAFRSVVTLTSKLAFIVGDGGGIFRYGSAGVGVPGGMSQIPFDSKYDFRELFFSGGGVGYIVGKYGIVVKTTNLGKDWRVHDTLPVNWLNSANFINVDTGFVAGSYGSVFKTTNGGTEWSSVPTGINNTINKIYFISDKKGWIAGSYGLIMKTDNAVGTPIATGINEGIKNTSGFSEKDYILHGNYPNPFNPATNISFELRRDSHINLKIYNIMGELAATAADGLFNKGRHTIYFNGSDLPSGIYFCSLESDGVRLTRKMTLIK